MDLSVYETFRKQFQDQCSEYMQFICYYTYRDLHVLKLLPKEIITNRLTIQIENIEQLEVKICKEFERFYIVANLKDGKKLVVLPMGLLEDLDFEKLFSLCHRLVELEYNLEDKNVPFVTTAFVDSDASVSYYQMTNRFYTEKGRINLNNTTGEDALDDMQDTNDS